MSNSDGRHVPPVVPRSPFSTILNFRDVGQTVNQLSQSQSLRLARIYRSARPDDASVEDITSLHSHYTIKTIIDLRSKTELLEQSKKLQAKAANDKINSLDSAGCNHVHVDLNGGPFAHALMNRLGWPSYFKMVFLYAAGWRSQAISILGTEVMQPRGLIGLAKDSLDHSRVAIRAVFELLGDQSAYPILIHCTQGKDRTGLITILLLLLLNVPTEIVDKDYRASKAELIKEEQSRLKEIRAVGLGEDFADCPEGFVEAVITHVGESYGGIRKYFEGCGLSTATLENIKRLIEAS